MVKSERAVTRLPSRLTDLRGPLEALDWDRFSLVVQREAAARLVIVGLVNAGKSTLFNLPKGRKVSSVTAVPGTTREVIEERMGPFILADIPRRYLRRIPLRPPRQGTPDHRRRGRGTPSRQAALPHSTEPDVPTPPPLPRRWPPAARGEKGGER